MSDFTITERTEPFTLDEVFSFIDDTNISEMDACELKSRIVDVVQAEKPKCEDCAGCTTWKCDCANIRAKAIDEFISELYKIGEHREFDWEDIYKLADQLKGGAT